MAAKGEKTKVNQLETIAENTNYAQYLSRMTASAGRSSKGLIPGLCTIYCRKETPRILDVGCGSGVLLAALKTAVPGADVTGLDLNQYAVDVCRSHGLQAVHGDLHALASGEGEGGRVRPFDVILFSSVLHEISSYSREMPFSPVPIAEALKDAYSLLSPRGIVIIRDGIRADVRPETPLAEVRFRSPEDTWFARQFSERFHGKPEIEVGEDTARARADVMKEFLYTYTWGKESWEREIQEQFGILTRDEWVRCLTESGFETEGKLYFAEEYADMLEKKVELLAPGRSLFEESTGLWIGRKRK